jgi:hypothetical protein
MVLFVWFYNIINMVVNMSNILDSINFEKYLKKHSPGYVIDIYNDGERYEYVIGNRMTNPDILETTSNTLYDIALLFNVK